MIRDFITPEERMSYLPRGGNLGAMIGCMTMTLVVFVITGGLTALSIYMLVGG
jgi:hypothetical protein